MVTHGESDVVIDESDRSQWLPGCTRGCGLGARRVLLAASGLTAARASATDPINRDAGTARPSF
jgi:hypothetical protein